MTNEHKLNRLVKIAVLIDGVAVVVARIIEFSNYIGYSINILVTNVMTGNEYDRNNPIRNRGSRSGCTKYRNCKTCYNRG